MSWGAGATPGKTAARGGARGHGGTQPDAVVPGMVSRRFCVGQQETAGVLLRGHDGLDGRLASREPEQQCTGVRGRGRAGELQPPVGPGACAASWRPSCLKAGGLSWVPASVRAGGGCEGAAWCTVLPPGGGVGQVVGRFSPGSVGCSARAQSGV